MSEQIKLTAEMLNDASFSLEQFIIAEMQRRIDEIHHEEDRQWLREIMYGKPGGSTPSGIINAK